MEALAYQRATELPKRWAPGSLLIIIPAYNEEACIADVVRGARDAMHGADVLVVDDGSADSTAAAARSAGAFVVRHPFNLGIGGTVQTGLKFARRMHYDYVLRMDGDGQHDPRYLESVLAPVLDGRADVAIGSRFLNGKADMKIPAMRRLGIRVFSAEVSLLTRQKATDTTSGLTAMNRRAVDVLARYMPQDYPEVESRVILHGAGLATEEVPVRMQERVAGVSSINNWRSLYYAVKVSVAVLLTAAKRVPKVSQGGTYAHRAAPHRRRYQLGAGNGHGSVRPQA